MDKKLNFLFTNRQWRSLLLKVFLFGLALVGIYFFSLGGNFFFLALFLFCLLLLWFYFSQLPERSYSRTSFLILVLTVFLILRFFGVNFYAVIGIVLIFSLLFYLLLGLTAFIFKNRHSVYLFLNTCLFLVVSLFFFGLDKSKYFLLINFLLFSIIYLLLKECFNFPQSAASNHQLTVHHHRFISLSIAFLGLELFWAISLLPIGFINSAILLALFIFLIRDFVLAYFSGRLNRKFFVFHSLVFVILAALIFITSKWSI